MRDPGQQATQIVIDLALAACLELRLGTPTSYADVFRRLQEGGHLPEALSTRLSLAAGFRNVVAHMYDKLDMERIHRAASQGPDDLVTFLRLLRDLL